MVARHLSLDFVGTVLRRSLDGDSVSLSAPASPVVREVLARVSGSVVGPVCMLGLLDLRFADACVVVRVGFGASAGLVVGVGNNTGDSSDAIVSVTGGGELSRG